MSTPPDLAAFRRTAKPAASLVEANESHGNPADGRGAAEQDAGRPFGGLSALLSDGSLGAAVGNDSVAQAEPQAAPHAETSQTGELVPAEASITGKSGAAPARARRVTARLRPDQHVRLKSYADEANLYLDQVLGEALTQHGEAVVAQLQADNYADRRRKGLRTDATSFFLGPADAALLESYLSCIPEVSRSRFITEVLERALGR